jgi:hypothetical protein
LAGKILVLSEQMPQGIGITLHAGFDHFLEGVRRQFFGDVLAQLGDALFDRVFVCEDPAEPFFFHQFCGLAQEFLFGLTHALPHGREVGGGHQSQALLVSFSEKFDPGRRGEALGVDLDPELGHHDRISHKKA